MLDTDHGRDSFSKKRHSRILVNGIFKEQEELVGHMPIELFQLIYDFLNESNENFVEKSVSGKRMREVGLVVSAKYVAFTKTQRTTNILHSELKNKKGKYDLLI